MQILLKGIWSLSELELKFSVQKQCRNNINNFVKYWVISAFLSFFMEFDFIFFKFISLCIFKHCADPGFQQL